MKEKIVLISLVAGLMMSGCGDNDVASTSESGTKTMTREECRNEGNKINYDFFEKKISVDMANQLLVKHKEKCNGLSKLSKTDKFTEEKHEAFGTPTLKDLK